MGRGDHDPAVARIDVGAASERDLIEQRLGDLQPARAVDHGELFVDDFGDPGPGVLDAAHGLGCDRAVADRDDAVDAGGDRRVVGDDDDRQPELVGEAAEEVEDLLRGVGVQLAGRLVGQ